MKRMILFFALLLICGTSNILWAQTRLKRFEIKEVDTPFGSLQVSHPDCAIITVHSAIQGLTFESNMARIKTQEYRHRESRYIIYIYPDKQRISIKCPGFVQAEFPMFSNLSARQQFSFEINEAFDTQGKGDLMLITNPPGARISIDQYPVFSEVSPYEFKQFGAQSYGIRLEKERYEPINANIIIEAGKAKSQTFHLKALWADLVISSEPTNSAIYINNELKGNTPLSLVGVAKALDPGTYEIDIKPISQFYDIIHRTIVLEAGAREEINVLHRDNSGIINISSSIQPIRIEINGKIFTQTSGQLHQRMLAGNYSLKAIMIGDHKDAYEPIEREIQLIAGEQKNIPLTFKVKEAKLLIATNVTEPSYILTDRLNGKITTYKDSKEIPMLLAGDYHLRVEKPGYRVYQQDIKIIDKDYAVNIELEMLSKIYGDRIRSYRTRKYISGSAFLLALGASAYLTYNSYQNYDNYQTATLSDEVQSYRQKSQDAQNLSYICAGVDVLAGAWWIYSHLKQKHWQKEMQKEMNR